MNLCTSATAFHAHYNLFHTMLWIIPLHTLLIHIFSTFDSTLSFSPRASDADLYRRKRTDWLSKLSIKTSCLPLLKFGDRAIKHGWLRGNYPTNLETHKMTSVRDLFLKTDSMIVISRTWTQFILISIQFIMWFMDLLIYILRIFWVIIHKYFLLSVTITKSILSPTLTIHIL